MNRVLRFLAGCVLPVLIVLAYGQWAIVAGNPFFPPLPVIWDRFVEMWGGAAVVEDVIPSLQNFFIGFILACVIGVGLGLVIGRIHWIRQLSMPLVHFGRSIPPITLIPPLVVILGVGDISKIAIICLGAVFPVIISTIDGIAQTDKALLDAIRSMRLGPLDRVRWVWLPSASPSIFGGMQTGLQFAFILMVSSEMLAATRGIGFITMQAQRTFDSPGVWAGVILIALIGLLINYLFGLVRRRALAWHDGMRAVSRAR